MSQRDGETIALPLFANAPDAANANISRHVNIKDSNACVKQARTSALICRALHNSSVFVYPFHFYRKAPFLECRRREQLWTTLHTTQ